MTNLTINKRKLSKSKKKFSNYFKEKFASYNNNPLLRKQKDPCKKRITFAVSTLIFLLIINYIAFVFDYGPILNGMSSSPYSLYSLLTYYYTIFNDLAIIYKMYLNIKDGKYKTTGIIILLISAFSIFVSVSLIYINSNNLWVKFLE